jgi:hypothetical protein
MWVQTTLTVSGTARTYMVYQQHDVQNCGPSSIIMLVKQALDRDVAIGTAQTLVGQAERGLAPANAKISLKQMDARFHQWGAGGFGVGWTNGWALRDTLTKKWAALNLTESANGEITDLRPCTPQKPAICRVGWDGGNDGHFIVCLGKSGNDFLFLDPYYGVVATPEALNGSKLKYSTAQNSFNKPTKTGTITYALCTH